jgi:hypothetical protein
LSLLYFRKYFKMAANLKVNRKRKFKSWAWEFFELINVDSKYSTKCNLCMVDIQFVSSTTPMISHLKNAHFLTEVEHKKSRDNNWDQYNDDDDDGNIIESEGKSSYNVEEINRKSKEFAKQLINFIVATNQPLSVVDNPQFIKLVNVLNNTITMPCRQTFSYVLVPDKVQFL